VCAAEQSAIRRWAEAVSSITDGHESEQSSSGVPGANDPLDPDAELPGRPLAPSSWAVHGIQRVRTFREAAASSASSLAYTVAGEGSAGEDGDNDADSELGTRTGSSISVIIPV
jgi:hypothetical protein